MEAAPPDLSRPPPRGQAWGVCLMMETAGVTSAMEDGAMFITLTDAQIVAGRAECLMIPSVHHSATGSLLSSYFA